MVRYYGFGDRLNFSRKYERELLSVFRKTYPGLKDVRFTLSGANDHGVDCTVVTPMKEVKVDIKVRDKDYHHADVALEIWSKCYTVVGWTRDHTKLTDDVLWYWQDTKRSLVLPFKPLRAVFNQNWETWHFRTVLQDSGDWQSESTFVPISLLKQLIFEFQNPEKQLNLL